MAVCAARYATRVLGGVVGDVLGATIQLAELSVLVVMAVEGGVGEEGLRRLASLAGIAALPAVWGWVVRKVRVRAKAHSS